MKLVKITESEIMTLVKFNTAEDIIRGSRGMDDYADRLAGTYALAMYNSDTNRYEIKYSTIGARVIGSLPSCDCAAANALTRILCPTGKYLCTKCGDIDDADHKCLYKELRPVYRYHTWSRDPEFFYPNARAKYCHMGWECETAANFGQTPESIWEHVYKQCNPHPSRPLFHAEHDCSISGAEIISQPLPLDAWMRSPELDALCTGLQDVATIDCRNGGHIHLDRAFFGDAEHAKYAGVLITAFIGLSDNWNNFWKFVSGRPIGGDTYYYAPSSVFGTEDIFTLAERVQCGHYTAVNMGNDIDRKSTIELRFWGGTIDREEALAHFDISNAIACWAKQQPLSFHPDLAIKNLIIYIRRVETLDYIVSRLPDGELKELFAARAISKRRAQRIGGVA